MTGKVNYSKTYNIFLSYRRDGGEAMAILLRDRLVGKGYRVFLDVEGLNSGTFNDKLFEVIDGCTDFVMVCSQGSLDRCTEEGDWVRAEIAHALNKGKNIVPVMLRGFEWPDELPEDIEALRMQNGVSASNNEYFEAVIDRLAEKFLNSTPKKGKKLLLKTIKVFSAILGILTLVIVMSVGIITLLGYGENITNIFYVSDDKPANSETPTQTSEAGGNTDTQHDPIEEDLIPDITEEDPIITTTPPTGTNRPTTTTTPPNTTTTPTITTTTSPTTTTPRPTTTTTPPVTTTTRPTTTTTRATTTTTTKTTTTPASTTTTTPTSTAAPPVTYSISVSAGTGGSASGGGTFNKDSQVNLRATPTSEFNFDGWYSGGVRVSESRDYSFTAKESMTIEAQFTPKVFHLVKFETDEPRALYSWSGDVSPLVEDGTVVSFPTFTKNLPNTQEIYHPPSQGIKCFSMTYTTYWEISGGGAVSGAQTITSPVTYVAKFTPVPSSQPIVCACHP